MVRDDDIDALAPGGSDRPVCHDPTITGQDAAAAQLERCRKSGRPEVVPVLQAVGHEGHGPPSELADRAHQHRRAAHPIHIVVAVNQQGLLGIDRRRNTRYRFAHTGQRPRIVKVLQSWAEERPGGIRDGVAAPHQDCGDRLRQPKRFHQRLDGGCVRRLG